MDIKTAALARRRRVSTCKGPRSVLVALDTLVHKVHRNLLTAVTQWGFLSAEETPGKAPKSCLAKDWL